MSDAATSKAKVSVTGALELAEGHYWVRLLNSPHWDVYFWRDGVFWDHHDCGYYANNFTIGHRVYAPGEVS